MYYPFTILIWILGTTLCAQKGVNGYFTDASGPYLTGFAIELSDDYSYGFYSWTCFGTSVDTGRYSLQMDTIVFHSQLNEMDSEVIDDFLSRHYRIDGHLNDSIFEQAFYKNDQIFFFNQETNWTSPPLNRK